MDPPKTNKVGRHKSTFAMFLNLVSIYLVWSLFEDSILTRPVVCAHNSKHK